MPDLFDSLETDSASQPVEGAYDGQQESASEDVGWPDLNDAQERAVRASLKPQLVVAGPGTGKTRVLVCRAAYLLTKYSEQLRPSDLAVITFTRKAARQLTSRLAGIVGAKAQHVRAGTIHRFCAEILQEHGEAVGVPEDVVVAPEAVTDAFWQRWFEGNESWAKSNDISSFRQAKLSISRAKLGIETVTSRLQTARREYDEMLASRGMLDFDDLLVKARDAVNINSVRDAVRETTKAILVDEFQDTDPVQFHVVRQLAARSPKEKGAHLFCVADDDQSIYGFRGARQKNINDLIDRFGCSRDSGRLHILQTNYRSNRAIYEVAESVLPPEQRLKRRGEIETANGDTSPVVLSSWPDESQELDGALQQVREWLDDDVSPREIAVLAPWNTAVQALERRFLRAGIPCEASSTEPILQTPAVRRLMTTFALVERVLRSGEIADDALADVMDVVLPEDLTTRVRDIAHRSKAGLWGIFQRLATDADAAERAGLGAERGQLERVYAAIGNIMQHARSSDTTIESLAEEVLRQFGGTTHLLAEAADSLRDPLQADGMAEAADRLRRWLERIRNGNGHGRLLLYERNTRLVQVHREMIRHALDLANREGRVPNQSPAAFVVSDEDHPRPLDKNDLVCTSDIDAFLRWAERNGALGETLPQVLEIGGVATGRERLTLAGFDADQVTHVAPAAYRSPSLRLFSLLQTAVAPAEPEPAFPDYVMVDLETTSLDVKLCRVAEIGAIRVRDGKEVDSFDVRVELPDDLTDEEATTLRDVCGMDLEEDFVDALPLEEAWSRFCAFVDGCPIIAHNGQRFDFRILKRLHRELGSGAAPWTMTSDTLPMATRLCPDLPRHTAEHLRTELLDQNEPTAHRALADCRDQQEILAALQVRKATLQRKTALEPILPAALTGTLIDITARDEGETSPTWSEGERVLLEVGYRWALRDASQITATLRRLLPRSLPAMVRATPALYEAFDEERLLSGDDDARPGLTERLDALLAPYRSDSVREGLRRVLSHLALWGNDEARTREDVVTLSTYHSAKGLEFECVICTGVHDNAFPAYYANSPEDQAESRRLLYVGLTRAEKQLVVTYMAKDRFDNTRRLSPFLRSAPSQLLKRR
ncbi:3'-5' exonuclease [Longibacter salinarum]|uniref:DNA 3'-5' helicase n=1 Tax=Longibacter salinarum TaxID=1850348 RepID=A0A2A8CYT6_9BACT|nr:UvrD-helicase domain-containing protein [Longibacter salinarum]PEN13872.1 3'-5' exonuclease [Longibacter salinarum]